MKKYLSGIKLMLQVVTVMTIAIGCKKFADPPQFFEEYGVDSVQSLQRKVLVVVIDGAAGSEVSALAPTNIAALQKHGKYTYNMRSDGNSTRAGSLASVINGVGSAKHLISDSTFVGRTDAVNPEDVSLPNFPNMFNYLLQKRQDIKTAAFTPWQPYAHYLRIADYHLYGSNDTAVRDSAVKYLTSENALGAVIVNFNEVDVAGQSHAYLASDAAYKAAIEKTDGYLGDLLAALKQRKNAAKEDWLVMVVSPFAGQGQSVKNGFLIVSNPKLSEKEVRRTGFSNVHIGKDEQKAEVKAVIPNDKGLYDAGADKEFSAQITVRFDAAKSWPAFFGKTSGVDGSKVTGWVMIQSGNNVGVIFGGTDNGSPGKDQISNSISVIDGKWHTLTITVAKVGNERKMMFYVDGETTAPAGVNMGTRNLSTSAPLTIGFNKVDGSGYSEFNAINAIYFNKVLSQETIKNNLKVYDPTKHTEYAHITGFWPLDDGGGPTMANLATGASGIDFLLRGPYTWKNYNHIVPSYYPPIDLNEQSIIAGAYDVAALMMYWLRVEVLPAWNLDGNTWLRYFDREIFEQ